MAEQNLLEELKNIGEAVGKTTKAEGDYFQEVWKWIQANLLSLQALKELGVVALLLGLAYLVQRWLGPKIERCCPKTAESGDFIGKLVKSLSRTVHPLALVVLLATARGVAENMEATTYLLASASKLAQAWLAVRILSSFITNRFWAKTFGVTVLVLATLSVLNLLVPTLAFLHGLGINLGDNYISVLLVLKGAILLAFLIQVATFLVKFIDRRIQDSRQLTPSVQVLFSKAVKISLYAAAFLLAVSALGVNLTGLAVLSGAIGVGIGFGLQKIFSNLVSGVILLLDKSIKPGDTIEVGGVYGKVNSLNFRFTSVVTRDGKEYLVPNENLITNEVVNWTYSDTKVRLKVPVGVAYDSDLRLAMNLLEQAGKDTPRVLGNPAPRARLVGFGDSSVDLELRAWIADSMSGVVNVKSEILLRVWDLYAENKIEIPFPQRDVLIKDSSEIRVRLEKGGDKAD